MRRVINGPIPYAPDGNPLIGPAAGAPDFFHCCAFSFGIVQAGGAGRVIAEWLVNGEPDWDVWPLDCRRYLPFADRSYALAKALETYQNEYAAATRRRNARRGARRTSRSTHASPGRRGIRGAGRLGARGVLRERRRPAGPEVSFRRPHWHLAVARECAAVASAVGVLDMPGFGRFEVSGEGAAAWLDHLITGRLPREGRTALSYLCSARGGIVAELTVSHLPGGRFWLMRRRSRRAPRRGLAHRPPVAAPRHGQSPEPHRALRRR